MKLDNIDNNRKDTPVPKPTNLNFNPDKILDRCTGDVIYKQENKILDNNTRTQSFNPDRLFDENEKIDENLSIKDKYNPDKLIVDSNDMKEEIENKELTEKEKENVLSDYFNELKDASEYKETLKDKPFKIDDLKKLTKEETEKMRDDYEQKKINLRKQWEEKYNKEWPTYKKDIVYPDGTVKHKGDRYDMHHIQPLSLGGKNEVENITPLAYDKHHTDVHGKDNSCSKLNKIAEDNKNG